MNEKIEPKKLDCTGHSCIKCGKELYPQTWKSIVVFSTIIAIPFIFIVIYSIWLDTIPAKPSCYFEVQLPAEPYKEPITARVFVKCPKD